MFEAGNGIRETGIIGPRCREDFMPLLTGGPLVRRGIQGAGVSRLRGAYCMHRPQASLSAIVGTLEGRGFPWP